MEYPIPIQNAVKALCNELCKHYPGVFNKTYDSAGFPTTGGSLFEKRMEMGVYIELIKAGETFGIKQEVDTA